MSLEAPIQIDLSQENWWEQVDDSLLTPEDKAFLREQFQEAREGILYLTREEIQELRVAINATRDPRGEMWSPHIAGESFQAFIEEQVSEGLSFWDILGEDNEIWETIETLTQELLFWPEWAMWWLELADTPKQNLTTALRLSILDIIYGSDNPQELINNPESLIAQITPQLELLRSTSQIHDPLPNGETHPRIWILGEWEQNIIMMNIAEGREFFNELLSWELDAETIEQRLEWANTQEEITLPNISELSSETQEILTDIRTRMGQSGNWVWIENPPNPETLAAAIDQAPESERRTLIDILKELLAAFGTMFAEMFESAWNSLWERPENTETPPEEWTPNPEVTPTSLLLSTLNNLSTRQLGRINKENLLLSLADSETQTRIMRLLENLLPEMNLEDTITHLFTSDRAVFSNFQAQLVEANFPALTSEASSSSPLQQFEQVLQEYYRYRQSEGVQGITEGRTTWQNYARTRRSESWATV